MADGDLVRCQWTTGSAANMVAYHDDEWGVPLHDDRALFELLILEGAQAGLSWTTILNRRDGYRRAFAGFDIATVAAFGSDDETRLLADPGIVRNRAKVASTIGNARAALAVMGEAGSLDRYFWSFVDDRPVQNRWQAMEEIPAETDASRDMSNDLKRRGFSFVGPTIMYAFMQSAGLVNDHQVQCFRYDEVARLA
ncbi:MAG TPA: DNA-3-methyladenine glycosylase I [Candidatus Limnocylindria bacterium]|nr:DNA-3-methyladenine glycosylase I [Candidatus Limnocylindria bacterium]